MYQSCIFYFTVVFNELKLPSHPFLNLSITPPEVQGSRSHHAARGLLFYTTSKSNHNYSGWHFQVGQELIWYCELFAPFCCYLVSLIHDWCKCTIQGGDTGHPSYYLLMGICRLTPLSRLTTRTMSGSNLLRVIPCYEIIIQIGVRRVAFWQHDNPAILSVAACHSCWAVST